MGKIRLKILHTNFHRGWGGQSNRILVLCRSLVDRGHDITIAAPEGSELLKRASEFDITTFGEASFPRGFRPAGIMKDVRALRSLVRKEQFEIIHTHGSQDSWSVAYAMRKFKPRPFVVRTKHNVFPIRDHFANRWLYGKATDNIVCISRAIMGYCAAKPYLRADRLTLIHSAVNADYFSDGEGWKIRKEFNVENRFVIGITGRLRPEKGHRILLEAIHNLSKNASDIVCLIAGSGSLMGELTEYAKKLGVSDKVIFAGFRKDVRDILSSLDVFVMPSLSEGLGTAVLEAAAAERPIVASDVGGIPDIIQNRKSGLLVLPGSPGELAHAIHTFYADRNIARSCALHARQKVRAHFSEENLAKKTEDLYKKLLSR